MTRAEQFALDAAKEIMIARVGNTNLSISKEGGEQIADCYEAIYKKLLELAKASNV